MAAMLLAIGVLLFLLKISHRAKRLTDNELGDFRQL